MEAGNRCWDWNVPEMINRKIVDHISDINLPYTENSRRYLLSEGIDGKTIFVTGSPMREVLNANMNKINESTVLDDLRLEKGKYFLVSAHREENVDNEENFKDLMASLNEIAEKYDIPVVYSTHPRSKKRLEERNFKFDSRVKSTKPFGFIDYVHLQQNAYCVLSDSGTLSEESAMLGFPAVLIRTSTERPEVLDSGNIVVGGIKTNDIVQSVEMAVELVDSIRDFIPRDYEDSNVSDKVVRVIQSYTKIVDITVWNKR